MTFFVVQVKLDLSLTYSGIPDQDEPTMEDSAAPGNNYSFSSTAVQFYVVLH